jgi:hypothetical protein
LFQPVRSAKVRSINSVKCSLSRFRFLPAGHILNSNGSSTPEHWLFVVKSLLAGLCAILCGVLSARAADTSDQSRQDVASPISIERVEVGFQGLYKVGEWTPLRVTVRSSGDVKTAKVRLVVDAPDSDDNVTSLTSRLEELAPGKSVPLETCFRTGRLNGELQFEIHDAEGRSLAVHKLRAAPRDAPRGEDNSAAELPSALKLGFPLWVSLGEFDLAAAFANAGTPSSGANPDAANDLHLARFESLVQLPAQARALQSVDLLILPTRPPAAGGDSILNQVTEKQDAVLQEWVRMGGHLLISVGAETAAYQKSPLAKWVPIKIDGQAALRQLSGFESFSGRNAPLKIQGTVPASRLATQPRANVMLSDASNPHPLVASVPWGFGRVTIIAIDIDAPPLSNWAPLKSVLQKIARTGAGAVKTVARKTNRQLTHVGVTDLATQFQVSNEDFSSVRRPSYWFVMGLILLYVAVIGPLDYLLVHRLLRRPEFTWLTFPILMAAGIAAAAWYADRANGRSLQINQVDLVDIDSTTGTVRNNTWVSLYSPEHQRFAVAVEPAPQSKFGKAPERDGAVHLSWMSVPENSVGGMYRLGGANFGGSGYHFGVESEKVDDLPVAHWSTKTVSACWRSELMQPVVDCRLESLGTGQLRGKISQHLGVPLEDCLIVASGWAYLPTTKGGTLQPGAEWLLGGGNTVRQRDLRALLTGEKQTRLEKKTGAISSAEITTTAEAYNPLDRDIDQQVRMMTFHEAAGGSEYTGLSHAALRGLELTDLMQLGRAILIGRVASSPARVIVDGAAVEPAGHSTWVRLVLPIVQSGIVPDKIIPKASETRLPDASEKRNTEP